MLIALLAVLGVDLMVLVFFVAFVLTRKHWVKGQPGAFRGAIRVKRLGDKPTVIRVRMNGARVEVAVESADSELLLGPYRQEVT